MLLPGSLETFKMLPKGRRIGSSCRSNRYSVEIAEVTGPLSLFSDNKVLVLADAENWIYSARNLGSKVSFHILGEKLRLACKWCSLHAFYSRMPGDDIRSRYLEKRGWTPHPNEIEDVTTFKGNERRANCDNFLLFMAGVLVSRSSADVIVIGSGDGRLSGELARALHNLPKKRSVFTLSLAGSTAASLNAIENPFITGNIELGQDCLRML